MKKLLFLFTLLLVVSPLGADLKTLTQPPLMNAAALVSPVTQPSALTLIFRDEFNGASLNTTKWMTQLQWGRTNPPELQYYASNAFRFSDGILRIVAEKKPTQGKAYRSGALITYKSFKFTYGIVQIRARIPAGKGLWPALWLLDYAGGAQEIDIMEAVGHQPNTVHMNLHYPTSNGTVNVGSYFTGPNFSNGFHIFTVDWNASRIIWYVDGVERYRITQHIPNKPMYLIMNLAVGGEWPGAPNRYTKFPAYFNIDYVRIYKRQ